MGGGITDRERAIRAETRVAELEDELAAYRASASEDAADEALAQRVDQVRAFLKRGHPIGGAVAAATLLALLDRPGRVLSKQALLEASRRGCPGVSGYDPMIKIVDVQVSFLRRSLKALGFPQAIRTSWGLGYSVDGPQAAAICAAIAGAPSRQAEGATP